MKQELKRIIRKFTMTATKPLQVCLYNQCMGITRLTQYILYICADPSARYKVQLAMYENCVIKVSFVYTSKTKCRSDNRNMSIHLIGRANVVKEHTCYIIILINSFQHKHVDGLDKPYIHNITNRGRIL